MKRLLFIASLFLLRSYDVYAQDYLNYASGKPVSSSSGAKSVNKITDGTISGSQWKCEATGKEQYVEIDMTAHFKISAAHIYFNVDGMKPLSAWVLQAKGKNGWSDIPGTKIESNSRNRVVQCFDFPVETDRIRLLTKNDAPFGLSEIQLWGDDVPAMPYGIKEKEQDVFTAEQHWVCANQVAYNTFSPKAFTVPTAHASLSFSIVDRQTGKRCFKGRVKEGKGDFSKFKPTDKDAEYVIRVEGGPLRPGESYPFKIFDRAIQEMSYPPAVAFMNDARSLVGTHPSAYGGTPWRDGAYYTYEMPSMVLLYLSDKEYFDNMPVTLSWEKDSAKVLSPDFKKTKDPNDRDALTTLESYYTILPKPERMDVPDIIQNIRFTAGWYLLDPITHDPSGDPTGEKMHAQTVEQFAYFLYAYPAMREYVSEEFYRLVLNATLRWWGKVGLFDVIQTVGNGKGRDCPGHSIMPNLLMYEVAMRECPHLASRFMDAAVAQTRWVIDKIDWNTPETTKGQRISEHKLVTGLVHFYLNYPGFAPEGLSGKIRQLGERYVKVSDNMWDFRRYDMDENWTVPGFNECGNVAAFPACAFGVAMCVDDERLKNRLIELGYSHFDNLFGRNPLNVHAANHPDAGFIGVDSGFPFKYHDDVCARLELTRGSISSLPGSEMYPFNPKGKHRWPEGWTAYNACWNVGLAFLNFFEAPGTIGVLKDPCHNQR